MATHTNLVIEDDRLLSSKIGRVLFVDFQKNPSVQLSPGDIIQKGKESLEINYIQEIRSVSSEGVARPVAGVKVTPL